MKLKLRLDKKTIQEFLLQNVEKIVLGTFVLVFLWLLYAAWTDAERFDRTPDKLEQAAHNGQEELNRTPPESGLTVADYASQAKRSRVRIEQKPYSHLALWDPPLFVTRPLRDTPPLLALEQLRGTAEVGAFRAVTVAAPELRAEPAVRRPRAGAPMPLAPVAKPAAGEDVHGQRWIVLTALVPVEKQEATYADTFKPSVLYDSQRDYPVYFGYWVERVEVTSPGEATNPHWEKAQKFMSKEETNKARREWAQGESSDVVAEEYLEKSLVFPLGPLVGRFWGASVAHEPEIPIKKAEEMGPAGGERMAMAEPPRGGRPPRPGRDDREAPPDDSPFGNDELKPTEPGRNMPTEVNAPSEEKKAPAYKLFRFFDFSVQPGKQYVYRVRLALQNPNRDLKVALLKKPELAELKYLETKWSDPSPAISVPRDTRILAVSVTPSTRIGVEPWCTILVTQWLKSKGVDAFVEKRKIGRGQVADFMGETFRPTSSTRATRLEGGAPPMFEGRGRPPVGMSAPSSSRELPVDYVTGATVLDFRGGERLPGRKGSTLIAAGEILLLDADGTVVVRDELDDTPAYEQLTSAAAEPLPGEGGGPGPAMGPGGVGPKNALDMMDEGVPKKEGAPKKKTTKPK